MLFIGVCRTKGCAMARAKGWGSRVKDDLSLGVDTVLCAMVLTIVHSNDGDNDE